MKKQLALIAVAGIAAAVSAQAQSLISTSTFYLQDTNFTDSALYSGDTVDLNLRFSATDAGQSFDSLILYGASGQTITETIDVNSITTATTYTATEIPDSGYSKYFFALPAVSLIPDQQYILELRANSSSGGGIYIDGSYSNPTGSADAVWFSYDGVLPDFQLGTATPTPEPSTLALAGLGISGLLAARRRK